ncbi:MAG: hypothetical protein AMXMBFR59_41000 [Rhodanobacteraceae bacterium]
MSGEERAFIAELQQRKRRASEGETEAVDPALQQWMRDQLDHFTRIGPSLAQRRDGDVAALDALMVQLCED